MMVATRTKRALALLLAAAGLAVCVADLNSASAQAGGDKSDQDRFQGTWEIASLEGSKKQSAEESAALKGIHLQFQGEKFSFDLSGKKDEGTFKLDPKQNPRHIDLTLNGDTVKGIYVFEGEGIKFCTGGPEDPRPKDFKADDTFSVVVLKRAAAKAAPKGESKKLGGSRPLGRFVQEKSPPGGEQPRPDKDYIQGTWEVFKFEKGGIEFPPEFVKMLKLTIKGEKAQLILPGETKDGVYKIDPGKQPKTIDITVEDQTVLGIYRLEKHKGEKDKMEQETIVACLADPGQPRPTEFKSVMDSPNALVVFRRATDVQDKDKDKDKGKDKDDKKDGK